MVKFDGKNSKQNSDFFRRRNFALNYEILLIKCDQIQ